MLIFGMMLRSGIVTVLMFLFGVFSAQNDTIGKSETHKRRLCLGAGTSLFAGGSLLYLNQAWYKDHNTGRFHFFDDNGEWFQMDKAGHIFSTYQGARLMMDACKWGGFTRKQQLIAGGAAGFLYMTAIEVFDGFSQGWGFSWGDMAANSAGTALALIQEGFLKDQLLQLKFSYFPSPYPKYNPSLLGENDFTRVVKDYNGQVYWVSFNPFHLRKHSSSPFPRWLNLAFGYGATGMTGARTNMILTAGSDGEPLQFERERLFFVSMDVDLSRIPCRSKMLKAALSALNVLKVPFPAFVVGTGGSGTVLIR